MAYFQPLKLWFQRKFPHVGQFNRQQQQDRIYRLMSSEEGLVVALILAEEIENAQRWADNPNNLANPQVAAHANGAVFALRGFYEKLERTALRAIQDQKRAEQKSIAKKPKP